MEQNNKRLKNSNTSEPLDLENSSSLISSWQEIGKSKEFILCLNQRNESAEFVVSESSFFDYSISFNFDTKNLKISFPFTAFLQTREGEILLSSGEIFCQKNFDQHLSYASKNCDMKFFIDEEREKSFAMKSAAVNIHAFDILKKFGKKYTWGDHSCKLQENVKFNGKKKESDM